MSTFENVKIASVCSLARDLERNRPTPSSSSGSASDDKIAECAMCGMWIVDSELKWHIWMRHFPWYQTIRCKKCRLKLPNEEMLRVRHTRRMTMSGHSEFEIIDKKLPYLEKWVDAFCKHSHMLKNGQFEELTAQYEHADALLQEKIDEFDRKNYANERNEQLKLDILIDHMENEDDNAILISPSNRLRKSTQNVRCATDSLVSQSAKSKRRKIDTTESASNVKKLCDRKTPPPLFSPRLLTTGDCGNVINNVPNQSIIAQPDQNSFMGNIFTQMGFMNNTNSSDTVEQQQHISATATIDIGTDFLIDSKNIPVFSINNGTETESFLPTEISTPRVLSGADRMTCDFCGEKSITDANFRQHALDKHSDGYSLALCSFEQCDFKSNNQGRVVEHCRSVHGNAKLMKRALPTPKQLKQLKLISDMMLVRGVEFYMPGL